MGKIDWKNREQVNQYAREYRAQLTEEKKVVVQITNKDISI